VAALEAKRHQSRIELEASVREKRALEEAEKRRYSRPASLRSGVFPSSCQPRRNSLVAEPGVLGLSVDFWLSTSLVKPHSPPPQIPPFRGCDKAFGRKRALEEVKQVQDWGSSFW